MNKETELPLIQRLRELHADLTLSDGGECEATALYREAAEALEAAAEENARLTAADRECAEDLEEAEELAEREGARAEEAESELAKLREENARAADTRVLREALTPFVNFFAMVEADAQLSEEPPLKDDRVMLSFMGCGASDFITVGDFRKARAALSSCPSDG